MSEPVARLNFDQRIKLPCHALFVGASMSGKSRLLMHLVERPELFSTPPKTILFYFDQMQPQYLVTKARLAEQGIDMQLRRGSDVNLDKLPQKDHQTLVIIDDASEETASSKEVARIATNGRHKNLSLWLVWHSLFSRHAASRVITQNIGLFFFLASPRLESQLRSFGSQLGMKQRLTGAYKLCLDEAASPGAEHNYIVLDLRPSVPNVLRVRSNVHEKVQYCYS